MMVLLDKGRELSDLTDVDRDSQYCYWRRRRCSMEDGPLLQTEADEQKLLPEVKV